MSREKAAHVPGNLPADRRGFVGRSAELDTMTEELDPEREPRLLTLLGVGGVGKTRLALRAADRVRETYPDGVWLVELSPVRARGQVPLAVMEALRLADQTTGSVTEALCVWARDKRLLLILDSCEHLLADCADLVADLLAAAPGVLVLATSRERLGVVGERTMTVEPLPVTDADALFVQRATTVDPGFVLDATTGPRVTDICRILDGIPLAIELAAVRLGSYSLDKLHELLGDRLRSRFDVLAGDGEEGPPRHWTLRTTIGWSHELCAPLERLLWARLSVFAGTFTVGAATWVCSGGPLPADRVADVLMCLAQQSIVLRHPEDTERFRLLDTVREYGAEWLHELGEEDAVRLRHRDHYRRFAREACADVNTSRQVAWCERVSVEHANLLAATDCALADPGSRVALEMAGSVGFLWRHCGFPRDAQSRLERVLAHEHAPGPELFLALWARSAVATIRADLDAALVWGRRCVGMANELGDPADVAAAASVMSRALVLQGRPAEGIAVQSAAPRLPVRQDWYGVACFQGRLALGYAQLLEGALDEARRTVGEVRQDSLRCGERFARAVADSILAHVALMSGDHDTAVERARESLLGHRLVHPVFGAGYAYDVLVSAMARGEDGLYAARLEGVGRRVWETLGHTQPGSPRQVADQRARERLLRDRLGDDAYERAYAQGAAMSYDEGLDHALNGG